MHILIDLDGPVYDFEAGIYRELGKRCSAEQLIHPENRTCFRLRDQYPVEHHALLFEIMCQEGFYLDLPLQPGVVEAVHEMAVAGYDVSFCTAPVVEAYFCASEKLSAIGRDFGGHWRQKTFITWDKTGVQGDILIDDRYDITGKFVPTWKQLLWDMPNNQHAVGFERISSWPDWRKHIYPGHPGLN